MIGTIHAVIIGFRRGHAERRREPIGDGTRLLSQPSPGRRADRVCGNGVDWVTEKRRKVDCSHLASDAPPRKRPPNRANLCFYIGPELKLAQIQLCMGSGLAWPLAYTARVKRLKKHGNGTKQDLIAEPGNRAKLEEEGGRGSEPEPRVLAMRAACHVV